VVINIKIQNFKSIKDLSFSLKKINIFIGAPNVGKSNILEAIGLFSFLAVGNNLNEFIRYDNIRNLFFHNDINNKVDVIIDDLCFALEKTAEGFRGQFSIKQLDQRRDKSHYAAIYNFSYDYTGKDGKFPPLTGQLKQQDKLKHIKFYKFMKDLEFSGQESYYLLPPHGQNMFQVLFANPDFKKTVNELIDPFYLKLALRPEENRIEFLKQEEDTFIFYPYKLISETLKRIIFYLIAIKSNKNSTLCFEEPEVHAFPYYVKFLAETIAFDPNGNQYLIATHNPYFLLSLIEKVKRENIAIFLTYLKEDQTQLKVLNDQEIQEIMDQGIDIFFNIDKFLEP
jgi:hypothetical protein